MTANQVVAYNVAKARSLRQWTQQQAAERLAPFLGARLSPASFSALERSAWNAKRIKVFSADELVALARGFDLPIGFFPVPPPPADGILLSTPAADGGEDPVVLLDAVLGTSENLVHFEEGLLGICAPPPPDGRGRPGGVARHAEARRLMSETLTRMGLRSHRGVLEVESSLKLVGQLLDQLHVAVGDGLPTVAGCVGPPHKKAGLDANAGRSLPVDPRRRRRSGAPDGPDLLLSPF